MSCKQPNILCFVTDQLRADHLGCYGNPQVRTPNIDRIAREGILFTESYVANPVCMPNRASLFTGRFPKAHGVRENGIALDPDETVLPELLREAGYQTVSIGKIHLAPFGARRNSVRYEWELYESKEYWDDENRDLPLPFYGFEEVCLVDGHGPYVFGHYKRWLDAHYPGEYEKLSMSRALEPPTGARECWKASIPPELHYNTFIGNRAIEWLRERRTPNRPFFMWCSFPDPHHPYSPPRPYCDLYDPKEIDFHPARREGELDKLPDYFRMSYEGALVTGGLRGDLRKVTDEHYREIVALTYGMITMVDHEIGRILEELERLSLLENTIVVFISDHGDLMGDHWLINKGPYLYKGLVRVPTIWRVPGMQSGRTSDAFISSVDLCPTLLDLLGLPIPESVQGCSYKPLLSGQSNNMRESIYIEFDESYIGDRLRSIRTKEWALTAHAGRKDGLLFDLRNDPLELNNLWDDPAYQGIKSELMCELFRHTALADSWLPPKICHA